MHNYGKALFHATLYVFRSLSARFYGVVNNKTHGVPCKEVETFLSGKDVKRTVNGHRHNGELKFIRQLESATSERSHMSGITARTFRKNHKTCAVA